ncbi:isoprenylcysteine carboxyl methyltransferase family protein [Rhizobium sp. PDO1-076]|uniref:isoprenylcysteine carboxyl methyltransferase family protein n=1 Tax=Rhizobium sp. PDO1-076 TaxID=1125979 RepID=UPI00055ABCA3|nr:isoprenylcysteine carboxylmethyltransferase family protein [Rhizobium sp. PDO1-076]
MTATILLLAVVTLERLGELWLARRNTKALLARGATEVAPEHYPLIVVLHGIWIAGLWLIGWDNSLNPIWVMLFLILQVLRIWVLSTLGPRWTTRIIVLRNADLVKSGPYRFLNHPNYAVVIGEIAVLPLCVGMPIYALVFSMANAAVLTIRIRAESEALSEAQHVSAL